MTRIIAGRAGGRTIATPRGAGTRPTTDRVREALFSRLQALTDLDGASVLDLYAGSGALGLEAVSRGAARLLAVERHPATAALVARNARTLGLQEVVEVRTGPAERVLRTGPDDPFHVVLEAPDGQQWTWGRDGQDRVTGTAEDFALVVTQRREPGDTDLTATGEAAHWLTFAQAFAGPPPRTAAR